MINSGVPEVALARIQVINRVVTSTEIVTFINTEIVFAAGVGGGGVMVVIAVGIGAVNVVAGGTISIVCPTFAVVGIIILI